MKKTLLKAMRIAGIALVIIPSVFSIWLRFEYAHLTAPELLLHRWYFYILWFILFIAGTWLYLVGDEQL